MTTFRGGGGPWCPEAQRVIVITFRGILSGGLGGCSRMISGGGVRGRGGTCRITSGGAGGIIEFSSDLRFFKCYSIYFTKKTTVTFILSTL